MKRISRIFLFGTCAVILLAAACAPSIQGSLNLPGALAQGDLTGSPTASATGTTSTAETTTATAGTPQATATSTSLTPSTPVPGLDVILLNCQYCVDTVAHALLLIPRDATFKVISPPELASPSGNDDDDNGKNENGEDENGNGEARKFTTQLSGAAEVPGPADPDGSGTATITLRREQGEVCFDLTVSNIGPATAAHIHEGAKGVAGPVVVPLTAPTGGSSSGCISNVDPALIKNILQNPEQYYVNVHNAEFPNGAIRGQLGGEDNNGNGDDDDNGNRLGCSVVDRFRDTKLVLCRAEQNTVITLNVCTEDNTCTEVQVPLQSCAPTTGTPSPIVTTTQTATATETVTPVPITPTITGTSTPVPSATDTSTPTVVTDTPTASATSTSTDTPTVTATSTATSTPTP